MRKSKALLVLVALCAAADAAAQTPAPTPPPPVPSTQAPPAKPPQTFRPSEDVSSSRKVSFPNDI